MMTMRISARFLAVAGLLTGASSLWAQTPTTTELGRVVVRNDSDIERKGEVVQLGIASLGSGLKPDDLARVHVTSVATGKESVAQPIDLTGDHDDEALAFQVDVSARSSVEYRLTLGEKRTFTKEDFRVYGRFVRERFDDFGWENDKVAFRMYGEALETWEKEP